MLIKIYPSQDQSTGKDDKLYPNFADACHNHRMWDYKWRLLLCKSKIQFEKKQQLRSNFINKLINLKFLFIYLAGLMFFTALLLFNFLIPIALNILLEGIKVFIALFLWLDRKLYDP